MSSPTRTFLVFTAALFMACGSPNPDEQLAKGDAFVAQGLLKEGSIEYRAALQADANRGDIRLKLGDLYLKLDDPGAALREYVRAADLLPGNVEAQRQAGLLLLLAGRFEDAHARAAKAVELAPNDAGAQVLLGNTLAGLKDIDGAIAEYQEALALNPSEDVAYRNIAVLQLSKGDRAAAEAAFKKAIEVAPQSVSPRMALANYLWATGRVAEAEAAFKEALALDSDNVDANRALGAFYLGSSRAPEAEPSFQTIARVAKTTDATIALADYYVVVKRHDDGRRLLREVAVNPEAFAPATIRLAAIDVAEGLRAEGQSKLRQVLEKHPKNMLARLLSARLLVLDGKREEALAIATSITKDEPSSPFVPDAFAVIGAVQASLNRPEEAMKAFEEVLKQRSGSVPVMLALARLHAVRGNLDQASSFVEDALWTAPKNPIARAESVRVRLLRGDVARAKQELVTLRTEFPNAPAVLNLVAAQQLAEKQVAAARATYARAAELAPSDLDAFSGLIRIDLATGRTKEALARLEQGLKSITPSGSLYLIAAQAHAAAGDAIKTEEMLKKTIEFDPTRLEAYTRLGVLYVRQNRLNEAQRQFEETATRNPSSVAAGTMLGMLHDVQQRSADAEREYKRVLALDPTAAVAANNLSWIYVASNRNIAEAAALAKEAHRRLPDEPNVNDTLGWIYAKQGQFTLAIQHLEASIKTQPDLALTHYHLGVAYAGFGERDKARAAFAKALSLKTPFEGMDDAKKQLAELGG